MAYNPDIHHRRSIRLKGFDYTSDGFYFVTLCCHNRQRLFGRIANGIMILNEAGKVADKCWQSIPEHYLHAVLHEYVIMPDHIHGIIELSSDVDNSRLIDFRTDVAFIGALSNSALKVLLKSKFLFSPGARSL